MDNMDMNTKQEYPSTYKTSNAKNFVGIILIFIGVLLTLNILDVFDYEIMHRIINFPFFLMMIGILLLLNSKNKTFGIILTAVGAFFFLTHLIGRGELVFPAIIIAIGIFIILRQRSNYSFRRNINPFDKGNYSKDVLDEVSIFGGSNKIIQSDNFKGGNITAIFGGSEINLTQCKLAEGENIIDVLTLFGGAEIIVPRDWDVRIAVTPIFGGFSHKNKYYMEMPTDKSRYLVIKGLAIFGGGEIKSY
ncbi:MAG: LiaF transmembrane domain-containing protein [Syntrophothermus sp.]